MRTILPIYLLLIIGISVRAETYAAYSRPFIENYSRDDYDANTQNWCIAQDTSGVMWFGNTAALLWHNGSEWGKINIPNNSVVRSLKRLSDNTILAGSFSDFGSVERDAYGSYYYTSWINRIPEEFRDFSDVWRIHELNNTVYIQTIQSVLIFREGEFVGALSPQNIFRFSFISNGRYYIEDSGVGLKVLMQNELILVEKGDFFENKEIWFVGHSGGRLLAGTRGDGIYHFQNGQWSPWNLSLNKILSGSTLYCGLQQQSQRFIFGTVRSGILLTDKEGNLIQSIDRSHGMQNNTVLSLFMDREDNLWAGLDKGIDYIQINSPFSIYAQEDGLGTGYASAEYQEKLYLGTNQGVYTWSDSQMDFALLPGTNGQVWSFQLIDNQLFCCHHNGIYKIGDEARLVAELGGAWKILKIPWLDQVYIIGTYSGLFAMDLKADPEIWRIEGFYESSRILEFSGQDLWMSHGYKGVYKLSLADDLSKFNSVVFFGKDKGLPDNTSNEVFRFKDQVLIAAMDGFYQYNPITGLMEPHELWNQLLPVTHPVSKIIVDNWGRINVFHNGELTQVYIENDSLTYIDASSFNPLTNTFFPAFEHINFIDPNIAIIATVDGFVRYDRNRQENKEQKVSLSIKQVQSHKHRSLANQYHLVEFINHDIRLPYEYNHLQIDLNMPLFQDPDQYTISYRMKGSSEEIAAVERSVILQGLRQGRYSLEFLVKDSAGRIRSDLVLLEFVILPPWYLKWYAFIGYLLTALLLFTLLYSIYMKNLARARRRESIQQERKMIRQQLALKEQANKAEQELMLIKNQQLQAENRTKAEEIANSTMELVHKNKMLLDVKDTLKQIQKENDLDIRNSTIKNILRKIDRDLDNDENWIVFEKNFDEVHENFLNRLKEEHPLLTSKDLRLCAYLRMSLSSKEIAPLLRISVRSVEISRYRLRKKLNLPHQTSLSDYILHY